MKPNQTILAIETSCDETGVAIVRRQDHHLEVLHQSLASQIDAHQASGGVVPDIAAREHVVALPLMIKEAMAVIDKEKLSIDAVAVTYGPGLMPALAVGVNAARALSFAWQKPLIPVHHIEGHIMSALLMPKKELTEYILPSAKDFPALALIVSGGHTLLILIKDFGRYEIVGRTLDDAAGEAFDKTARLLGLPYPGGVHLSALAKKGDPQAFSLPRPMIKSASLDFSFSGLKTAVLYTVKKLSAQEVEHRKADLAASIQRAIVETLTIKVKQAMKRYLPPTLLVGGGVAANWELRQSLQATADAGNLKLRIAPPSLCGDNAIMIGLTACITGQKKSWSAVAPQARPPL